ncbi:MAG TPA: VOC family protein [Nitrolancea sp.]|nr:VOC family protein [Nitrolancea sp.]
MAETITPFLWFDTQAEEATNYYLSVFADSELLSVVRYGEAGPGDAGTVMTTEFRLNNQTFVALNGGPMYRFSPATSFVINVDTQDEVDHYWEKLTEGGQPEQCGWTTDKFGVTWQIVPRILPELLSDPDREKANRVMAAMLQMTKIEIASLEAAYAG